MQSTFLFFKDISRSVNRQVIAFYILGCKLGLTEKDISNNKENVVSIERADYSTVKLLANETSKGSHRPSQTCSIARAFSACSHY